MKIGIIGSGNMGSGLGRIWAKKGHHIVFSYSRSREKLDNVAASVEHAVSGTPAEAARVTLFFLQYPGEASLTRSGRQAR